MITHAPEHLSPAAAQVLARLRAVLDPRATVEMYGSSVYAPAHAEDVDLLVCGDDPARLAAALELTVLPTLPPRLSGALEGTKVDITVVNGDDELARRMSAGPRDAAVLAQRLREHGRDEVFQAAWPQVRRFVRARALGHNGLGWFGSFGWALLLAVPLVQDPELRAAAPGEALPVWMRWMARLTAGARIGFEASGEGRALVGSHGHGDAEALYLVAPSPPSRDVARLSKQAAAVLFAEARAAAQAIGEVRRDVDAVDRLRDLAEDPPAGTTLAIGGDDEHTRGRYDGVARGLLRELEALGAIRSWGRFELASDGSWQHHVTVPARRAQAARALVERWLELNRMDAALL
jgi:hypothetical protein